MDEREKHIKLAEDLCIAFHRIIKNQEAVWLMQREEDKIRWLKTAEIILRREQEIRSEYEAQLNWWNTLVERNFRDEQGN